MKLRLPNKLVAALMAAMSATVFTTLSTGSAAYGSTTYDDLTKSDYFEANENVYNTGKGTFYLETDSCVLNLTLTLNLNALAAYQGVHDYANAGYYGSFVTWTYNNNAGATYGMADVSSGYSSADYSGVTGMWNGSPWTTNNKITTTTLWNYADADGNVTLTINNDPTNTTRNVVVTAANGDTLYSADGLRSGNYVSQHITSFTVNMNYVTSVTLNSNSILNPSNFTAPKDYTEAFVKTRDESVGRIVFLGDSITHGVQDMSWRWGLFKTMVDNGIEYEIAGPLSGYHSDPLNGDYNGDFSSSQYGGATFDNAHYAQSSGRTHNMLTASNSGNSLGGSTGVNYGGVTSAKVGNEYNGDTYIMMMGTNDILSDGANTVEKMATVTNRLLGEGSLANGTWTNAGVEGPLVGLTNDNAAYRGEWGTMGKIIDNMKMGENDIMYVMPVPTWGVGRTGLHVYADLVPAYNEKLEAWTKAYSSTHTGTVKYVDINRGLVDKTLNGRYLAPDAFFRTTGGDYIHPNEQGALIIAGNLAQGMGLAGRTAGLHRADSHTANTDWVSGAASYTINAGQSVTIGAGALDTNGGYTVDFSALYGNGATDGWLDKSNALSISVGDGSNVGTLKLSEGYISWGDKLLFCQDNSVRGNDNIRITYHTGDTANQVGNGYYVWLGDMLIGQALNGSNGTLSGITLSSVGATGTVSGLTYSNSAYAPTSTGIASADNAFYASITKVMTSHDSTPISSGIDWTGATAKNVNNSASITAAGDFTDGKATVTISKTGGTYFGVSNVATEGNIEARVDQQQMAAGFAQLGNTLTGDLTLELSNSSVANGSFSGAAAALSGSYNGASITGTFAAYIDNTTFAGDIVGGTLTGAGSIGGVNLVMNSGEVTGVVYGGSKSAGTVGTGEGTAIGISVAGGTVNGRDGVAIVGSGLAGTVNGDIDITISGGVIKGDIIGKQTTGVTYGEGVDATVTVQGNKASITGNITADTVKLRNVAATDYSDGFDKYAGTITATNLVLDNYTAGLVNATLVTDYVTVSNGTNAIIRGLHLRNCSIDADEASTLTLGGTIDSGNTITYTGNLYLEDGTTFNFSNTDSFTAAEGAEGISAGQYIYKVKADSEGHLYSVDGSALTSAHTSTFTGAGVVAGKSFFYDNTTNALIAYGSDATYNIATSTVNYSDLPTAADITMSGGQLNLDTALNTGVTITATGGTVSVGEGVQFSTSSLSGTGTPAIVNNGGTVTLDTASTASSLFSSMTGDSGTMVMNQQVLLNNGVSSSFGGTLVVNNVKTEAYGDNNNNNKTGYDLVLGDNNTYNATADISSFSKVVLNNAGLYYAGNGTTINNLTLESGSYSKLKVEHMASGTLTFAGETSLAANSELTAMSTWSSRVTFEHLVGEGTLMLKGSNRSSDNDSATYTVNSLQGFSGELKFHKINNNPLIANISTGTGEDVTIKGISLSEVSNGKGNTVNIMGDQRLIVDGAVSAGANTTLNIGNGTATGTVTMNGSLSGTVNVLANSTLTLGDTFSAESATIAGAGYVDVHIKPTDTKTLSLHDGQDGYLTATVDLSAYQNKVTFNNTGWKVDGVANNATFDNNTYQLSVDSGNVFYVNTTVTKDEVVAPAGGGKAVLVGNGTYVLGGSMANNNAAWPGNAQISTDPTLWTGAVKFVNVSGMRATHDLNDYANSASWVHLNGISGWDTNWAGHLTANLILENNGSNAAWIYEAGASSLYYMSVDGKVKGDGTMLLSTSNNQGLSFTNDISGWTGAITSAQGTKSIKFSGDATEVNAQIVKTGGTMNVIAETDVTFNNTVTINALTATGHTVTVGSHGEGESATHGNLTLGAVSTIDTLVINDGGTVNATAHNSGTGFIKGTVNVNAGGTLNIVGDDRLGWGNNGTAAINMEGAAGKLATMTVSDKQTFSSTLNLNGYTNVINGEGSSGNKGLEIFQSDGHIGTINATGTNNTIATGVFLRRKTTITTAEGAELTISGVVKRGVSDSDAEMVKEGAGTLTLSGDNSFGGNLTVNAGTIVMGSNNALGAANNTGSRTITINSGATIDLHGTDDTMYKYTLAGGSLVNNGANTHTGHLQTMGLALTDDSTIGGTGNFYLINSRYANTAVDLGGHTLTKTGSNTIGFYSTAISGAAGSKVRVESGVLDFTRNSGWNQTYTSLDADLEVAKSSGNAVSGEFILADGHTISSTEVGGSVDAAIQLAGSTTLHTDGVNSLTLNGVLSNGTDATGSVTKTGLGTVILNAANTYTGTTTIDAGALVASNSNALSHSVLSFSDMTAEESPYRIFAFAENLRFNPTTHALEDAGTQIDGTIKGLDGHRGYVVANTLTIDVNEGEQHVFNHRYDDNNQTSDRVEMKINRLVKTGAGEQIIGGDYSEARGFTTNGLVISHGVEVQQGTLFMMTRGIVTTDFDVAAGATLKTSDEAANSTTAAGAVQYNGKVTLHGTTAENAGTLFYNDGSTNTTNGLYVDGFGKVVNQYDKMQFINGLYNAEDTTSNDITFFRPQSQWSAVDDREALTVLTGSGDFAGTVHLSSTAYTTLNEKYGLQVLGTSAQNALAGAVIDFTGDNVSVLSFRNNDTASSTWTDSKMDGAVGGLQGTNGSVYANTLTINTASADADYTFGGALNVTNITKQGAGTQTINSDLSAFSGNVTAQGGTLVLSNHLSGNTLNLSGDGTTVTFNHADDAESGTTFSGNIVANAAGGTLNVNGEAPLTANTISITAGTTLNFDQQVTLTLGGGGRNRPELLFNNDSKAATQVNFNGGYAYTGSNGYALCVGKDVTVTMGGTSTLTGKSIGLAGGATLTLKDNASLTVGTLSNSTTPGNNGTVNVGASATLAVTGTNENRITNLNLADSSTTSFNSTTSLETLSVDGTTANLALKNDGGALTVQKLLGGSDASLELYAEKQTGNLFKVNMGAAGVSYTDDNLFAGNLWVTSHSNQGGSARSAINMAVKAEDVLKNATVNLSNWKSNYNNTRVIMSLESDAKVGGINSSNTGAYDGAGSYIRSGAMTNNTPNGAADMASTGDTARTLEITGSGTYSTNAHVMENVNIAMAGEGTQTFTGDMSRFNGDLVVKNGVLDIDTDNIRQAKRMEVQTGGLLELKKGTSVNVNELVLGDHGAVVTKGETSAAALLADADEPTPYSDAEVTAHVTVGGTDTTARLEASGTTMVSTDLTVAGNTQMVYADSVPQGDEGGINLNGHSLTLSAEGGKIYITSEMLETLNETRHLTLFSNVGGLTLGGANFTDVMTKVDDNLYVTTANDFFSAAQRNPLGDQYTVAYNTVTKELYLAPEPTTAALSLLALGALAARRRRR